MAHVHTVSDMDIHYKIDGVTRRIVNIDETKRMLVQNDHNSERLTFEIPRRWLTNTDPAVPRAPT